MPGDECVGKLVSSSTLAADTLARGTRDYFQLVPDIMRNPLAILREAMWADESGIPLIPPVKHMSNLFFQLEGPSRSNEIVLLF